MLNYIVYEKLKNKYSKFQKLYDKTLKEKEDLLSKAQLIIAKNDSDAFDKYLQTEKKINKVLNEMKNVLEERRNMLNLKIEDLRNSKSFLDKIYTMRYIDHVSVRKIAQDQYYSESQIYRILGKIRNTTYDEDR